MKEELTASIIIIGNEILSGRVQDENVEFLAKKLGENGIALKEVRIISDVEKHIVDAVNSLRQKYTYIFTTGGIGPTHDDITSKSIAKAFNVLYIKNQEAFRQIKEYYDKQNVELNEAREKMAYMPQGAELIENDLTKAPGFMIENVFVMARIPEIMQNMFKYIEKYLKKEKMIESKNMKIIVGESLVANYLEFIQNKYLDIDIGSYPFRLNSGKHATDVVFRGNDIIILNKAYEELREIFLSKNYDFEK